MLDPKLILDNPKLLLDNLKEREMNDSLKDASLFVELRQEWKELKSKLDELRHKRNTVSESINSLIKDKKIKEANLKKEEAKKIAIKVKNSQTRIEKISEQVEKLQLTFPNIPSDLPKKDKIISEHGVIKKQSWFKTYEELVKDLNLMDFDTSTNISGAGFYLLKGNIPKLERALVNFFLDTAKKNGYEEFSTPYLVTEKSMTNSGQLPKFKDGMFYTNENLYLIPTAEVPLLNINADKTLNIDQLPINITAFTPCFRVEKGATKAYMRVKQFSKVELFKFVKQEDSFNELELMLNQVTKILEKLKLPFRIKLLSAPEMGFASTKTYDVEVFVPGSKQWLEVSSISNCLDFQSRRANIKYVENNEKKFVHTLNGSGLAIPRVLIAILENYQQKNGTIKIPAALKEYIDFDKIQ